MVLFESLDTVSYSHSVATMAVFLAVSEIFSVKLTQSEVHMTAPYNSNNNNNNNKLYYQGLKKQTKKTKNKNNNNNNNNNGFV